MSKKAPSFADFGEDFQDRVVQSLIHDTRWAEQMLEIIKVEYFSIEYLGYIVSKFYSHYHKYRTFPTIEILATILKDALLNGIKTDAALASEVVTFLKKAKNDPDLQDFPYIKDRALDFCKNRAMKDALDYSVELWDQGTPEPIIEVMKKALTAGEEVSIGHDFKEDLEARLRQDLRQTVPTGIRFVDEILDGGGGRGELHIFVGAPGVGKSHFLVQVGANAIKEGFNVAHYTLEMGEAEVGRRYDAWLTGIDSREVHLHKEDVREFYTEANGALGRLMIKEYPSSYATAMTIRGHIQRLELRKKFKPDVVIVDYADEMCSIKNFDSQDGRHMFKAIYRDLRNLARELNPRVVMWSASQSNREGSSADVVTGENMAESFRKLDVPDFVYTGACKPQMKAKGIINGFVAKNRGRKDGMVVPMQVDKKTSHFYVITKEEFMSLAKATDEEIERKEKDRHKNLRGKLRREQKKLAKEMTEKDEEKKQEKE